ncbi:DUF6152 family protein [Microbulbifer thermotolerans]|uniref:DUF6152 family protein n=1 Tax=Microbulbifer thermotolerans TaxID=252514 RepID=UPI0011138BE5|nr:DUF6152 family protein [Microbulbifer thermotolerans]MCX2793602.1 DUF6152 family protein [Microbulbifer thermotolerans]
MKKFLFKNICIGIACTAMFANSAMAHHGVNGQFDTSKQIKITGKITKIRLVNPHAYIYFDVKNSAGNVENWRCDLGTGSALKRAGWSSSLFKKGEEITIIGAPARSEDLACHANSIHFTNGLTINRNSVFDNSGNLVKQPRKITLPDGTPNIGGNWVSDQRKERPRPQKPSSKSAPRQDLAAAPEDGRPPRGERPPMGERPPRDPNRPQFKLTEAGEQAVAGYRFEDSPRLHCKATNIIDDWTFDQLVNRIDQTEDEITIHYGFMDIVRTIHLDLDQHPADIEPSVAGHSIGKWEDGVLIVDTIGFAPGYIHAPPHPNGAAKNSDQLHIVERFHLSDDGLSLHRSYEIEDPLYLQEKVHGEDVVKLTESQYFPYECDDLTYEKR